MDYLTTDTPAPCDASYPGWHTSSHKAPYPHTPLCYFKVKQQRHNVTSAELTHTLRTSCINVGENLVFQTNHISTGYLRTGGVMVILLRNIDADTI